MTSLGSTSATSDTEQPLRPDDFDTIEAEIDTIKAEVQHMRAAHQGQQQGGEVIMQDVPAEAIRRHRGHSRAAASKIPTPVSSAGTATPGMLQSDSLSKLYDAAEHLPGAGSSPAAMLPGSGGKSDKPSPHFAQPTQAAARRADETLRRESPPVKPSPETSPGKSTKAKAPSFETDKRAAQRQQKRTSLPEGWMSSPEQISSAEKAVEKRRRQDIPEDIIPASAAQSHQPGTPLRKKTSSYMSPTKAVQHRNVATLGEGSSSRSPPRIKARDLTINTALSSSSKMIRRSLNSPLHSGTKSSGKSSSDDTFLSAKSHPSSKSSGTRSSSDDFFLSPKSHLSSNASSRGEHNSKKRMSRPQSPTASSPMKLPLPLPEVANTTIAPSAPSQDLLNPIKAKLEKEDLLRRTSTPDSASSPSRRGSRSDILRPVFARLNRGSEPGSQAVSPLLGPTQTNDETLRSGRQSRTQDRDNQPLLRLITGLRGQSSAEIGRALSARQQSNPTSPVVRSPLTLQASDPAILYERRKPSDNARPKHQDPAIVYQGRKPSGSVLTEQDPAIIFSSGPIEAAPAMETAASRTEYSSSSLRATATDFVPLLLPTVVPMSGRGAHGPVSHDGLIWYLPSFGQDLPSDAAWHDTHARIDDDNHVVYKGWTYMGPEEYDPYTGQVNATIFQSAAGEPVYAGRTNETPVLSPTSDDTSPPGSMKTHERGAARWTITGKGRRSYLWTGRDGLEIGFKGHGPDAEHDPNSPVLYRNHRTKTKTFHMQAASFPRTHTSGSPVPPKAPKLMREHAERMGFAKVPCPDYAWKGKYDCLPTLVPVAGLCDCCKEGDNTLHRIGGGIELISQQ